MKKRLIFIIPLLILLGFLAFKPPALGSEKKEVIVTPTSTSTPLSKPNLRDFGDDGKGPAHRDFDHDGGPGRGQNPPPHPDGDFHHDDLGERDNHEQD